MAVDGILCIQQGLGRAHIDVNINPVLGRAVAHLTHAIAEQPLVSKVKSLIGWFYEVIDLIYG